MSLNTQELLPPIMLCSKVKIIFNLFVTEKYPLHLGNFAIYIRKNILQVPCRCCVAHEIKIFVLTYQQGKVGEYNVNHHNILLHLYK